MIYSRGGGCVWSLFRKVILTVFFSFCNHLVEEERSGCFNSTINKAVECMRGSREFCQRGSNFDNVYYFLVDEGREDPNTTKSGPSWTR